MYLQPNTSSSDMGAILWGIPIQILKFDKSDLFNNKIMIIILVIITTLIVMMMVIMVKMMRATII